MCTIRGLWMFRETEESSLEVLFSRRFSTVETRVKALSGSYYTTIPNDIEFGKLFMTELHGEKEYNTIDTPLLSIKNTIWPLVYLKRLGVYFAAIVVVEEYLRTLNKPALIDLLCVTTAISLLEDISNLVAPYAPKFRPTQMAELHMFIGTALPFGQPIDTNALNLKTTLRQGFLATDLLTQKRPAWKPFLYKGRQAVDLLLRERISCVLYDNPTTPDVWNIYGTLLCKADLEGMPEVTVFLTPSTSQSQTPTEQPEITFISIDPCVQTTVDILNTNKLVFSPPLDTFSLCSYGVKGIKKVPLRGFYQMKEIAENVVKLLIQLKLDSEVNNNFDYCVMHIPFKNRGNIVNISMSPTAGSVAIDPTHRMLVWNIGQKFTGRNLEVALPAEVYFDGLSTPHTPNPNSAMNTGFLLSTTPGWLSPQAQAATESAAIDEIGPDPFCTGGNSYVKLHFKIVGFSLSGVNVDTKKLSIFPNTKAKILVEREVLSSDYIIWNSLGGAKAAAAPPLQDQNPS